MFLRGNSAQNAWLPVQEGTAHTSKAVISGSKASMDGSGIRTDGSGVHMDSPKPRPGTLSPPAFRVYPAANEPKITLFCPEFNTFRAYQKEDA
jgi:hypothetical protein